MRWALPSRSALISLAWGAERQFGFFDIDPNVLDESFFKVPLRPGRLVAFLSVAIVAYTCATYLWVPIRRGLGWLMLPLGQAALYCYIVHFFLIVLVYNLCADAGDAAGRAARGAAHDGAADRRRAAAVGAGAQAGAVRHHAELTKLRLSVSSCGAPL